MIRSLGSSRELQQLRRTGLHVNSGPVTMIVDPSPDASASRVAFAIGRSVGGAVRRNRVRRRLRELLREKDAQGLLPYSRYLVICRVGSADASFQELRGWVDDALLTVGRAA